MISVEPAQTLNSQSRTLTVATASLFNYAVHRGISEHQLRAETGLVRTDLLDLETRLPGEILPTIWNILGKAYPGQAVGLEMARVAPLSALGPMAQIMRYATNLRSALDAFVCYGTLLSDQLWLDLVESKSAANIRLNHPLDAAL